jgi:flagellar biosynthetic protein FliO
MASETKADKAAPQTAADLFKADGSVKNAADLYGTGSSSSGDTREPKWYVTALSFIFKLAIVLGLAYVTILGLKKFSGMRGIMAGPGQHHIKVLENSSIGPNKSQHLVEIGSRRLLVASTPNQVNLLAELNESDLSAVDPNPPSVPPAGFKEQLSTILNNKTDTSATSKSVAQMLRESSSFLQGKVGEVGKLRRKLKDE